MIKLKSQKLLLKAIFYLTFLTASCTETQDARQQSGADSTLSSQKASSSSGRPTDSSEGLPGYFIICSFLDQDSKVIIGTTDRAACRLQKGSEDREAMLSLSSGTKWDLFNSPSDEDIQVRLFQSSLFEWDIEISVDKVGADQWGRVFSDLLIEINYLDGDQSKSSLTTVYESNDDLLIQAPEYDSLTSTIEFYIKAHIMDKVRMESLASRVQFIPGLSSRIEMLRTLLLFQRDNVSIRYKNTMTSIDKTIKSLTDEELQQLREILPPM